MHNRITVLGAGVVGLSCAVRLAEAGYPVDVLARDLPLETVSAVAGGLWLPLFADPVDAVARWSRLTYDALLELVDGTYRSDHGEKPIGVRLRAGHFIDKPDHPPSWSSHIPQVPVHSVDNPTPDHKQGWAIQAPLVDMQVYLPYLLQRLQAAGGTLTRKIVRSIPREGVVINCTGLSARQVAGDPSVYPIRGQIVHVSNPGISDWLLDESDLRRFTYVIPHDSHIVVGGTAEPHRWSTAPNPSVAAKILERASQSFPELRSASILSHRVGLRPARPSVRLETVVGPSGTVVHCYGHGGCGVTMSWGCADDVLTAVQAL